MVAELAKSLREMAEWLELDGIVSGERGDLVSALGAVINRNAGARPVSMVPR